MIFIKTIPFLTGAFGQVKEGYFNVKILSRQIDNRFVLC